MAENSQMPPHTNQNVILTRPESSDTSRPDTDQQTALEQPGASSTEALRPANTSAALPPGWQELVDDEGKAYYADHATRTTSFQRPEDMADGQLPPGWELLRAPNGVAFYADHNTRTTAWEVPR